MTAENRKSLNRRLFMGGAAALTSAAAALPVFAQATDGSTEMTPAAGGAVRNNVSSFRMLDWQDYFENTKKGAILVDITSRALHFWTEDQSVYKLYPTSVPLSDELTRRGKTEVIQKVEKIVREAFSARRSTIDWEPFLGIVVAPSAAIRGLNHYE